MLLEKLRKEYHKSIFKQVLSTDKGGIPNNADRHSVISVALAKGIIGEIAISTSEIKSPAQTSGKSFEKLTSVFLGKAFAELRHLRGGEFEFFIGKSIDEFEQYEHLASLAETLKTRDRRY